MKKKFIGIGVLVIIAMGACQAATQETPAPAEFTPTPTVTITPSDTFSPDPVVSEQPTEPVSVEDDVKITSCKRGSFGTLEATAKIKNSSAEGSRSYFITVSANDARGDRIGELNGAANSVAPGQTVTVKLMGVSDGDAKIAKCVVANLTSF